MELADDISYSLHDLEDAISLGMIVRHDWENHINGHEHLFSDCGLNSVDITDLLFADSYKRKEAIGTLVHAFITHTEVSASDLTAAKTELLKWNACLQAAHEALRKHIFGLVVSKVIKSANVQQLEFKGQKIVVELFDALNSDPQRLLPARTVQRYEAAIETSGKARVICDFISGMTDEYCTRLYEKLFYPHKGSIFDHL